VYQSSASTKDKRNLARLVSAIYPGMIGSALNHHIAGIEMDLLVQEHVHLAGGNYGIVEGTRAVHTRIARRFAGRCFRRKSHSFEDLAPDLVVDLDIALRSKFDDPKIVPFGGGRTPNSRLAASACSESLAGIASVTQRTVLVTPNSLRA
jgi:hypothetical protein